MQTLDKKKLNLSQLELIRQIGLFFAKTLLKVLQVFESHDFSAKRARTIFFQPRDDALRMEVVICVAGQRRHLIIFLVLAHADCALIVWQEVLRLVMTSYDCS